MIMTRSGAPFQGATGEGKTWISAASPHGAAPAGEFVVAKTNAAAATASRLTRQDLTTANEWRRPLLAAAPVERI
jgi:hypothetical protein